MMFGLGAGDVQADLGQQNILLSGIQACHSSRVSPSPSSSSRPWQLPVQRTQPIGDGRNMPNVGDLDPGPGQSSLIAKLRAHYNGESHSTSENSRPAFRLVFQFQVITQLYMTLTYLVPSVFSDFDPWSQYYLKVFACYLFAMGQANWLATICYSSALPDFRDRPTLDFNEWFEKTPETLGENGSIKIHLPKTDRNGLEWTYCTKCERYKPPRAHHCDDCKTCILRRDHHCYLIGCCIGHYNQRYFIPFMFYGFPVTVGGLFMTTVYLKGMPDGNLWYDFLYPVAIVKCCMGQVTWQFCLLSFHAAMLAGFGCMAMLYFTGSITLVVSGKTLLEVAKNVDIKVNSTIGENIRIVFGDYWLLNFLFPAVIIFKQRHDGINYEHIQIGGKQVKLNHKEI